MTDRPIIFSAPMVRALLDGRKTQTRRVINHPTIDIHSAPRLNGGPTSEWIGFEHPRGGPLTCVRWPYCPGDRLYVREAHALVPSSAYLMSEGVAQVVDPADPDLACVYREGWDRSTGGLRWRPSIHMPRWASRLTLTVTDARVQRLQEISEADACAEGVPLVHEGSAGDEIFCRRCDGNGVHGALGSGYGVTEVDCADCVTARQKFRNLWNSLHGPDAWGENPWVVALTFTVARGNIDTLGADNA